MAKKTYYQKLKDPRWQKKRLEILNEKNFTCEVCGTDELTLHVHHKEYFSGLDPWEYDLKQYAVLCEECHEYQHGNVDSLKYVCSLADMDGPRGREDCSFVMAGYLGIDYDGFILFTGLIDLPYHRDLWEMGNKIQGSWSSNHGFKNKE